MKTAHVTKRVLKHYRSASGETLLAGLEWYDGAFSVAKDLSAYGASVAQCAAVIAVLSPQVTWRVNLAAAREVCIAHAAGRRFSAYSNVPHRQIARAFDILDGEQFCYTGRNPKTWAFYRAILGDQSAVVLDVWALRAAGYGPRVRVAERRAVEKSYRNAAHILGIPPREVQAVVWCQVRGGAS
jgi:hypothetical protein